MKVWILVFYMSAYNAGGPAVIDNIATKDECIRVQGIIFDSMRVTSSKCIEVWKK